MRVPLRLRLVAAVPVAALALGPAAMAAPGDCRLIRGAETPDDTTDDVQVCRQDVWLHRDSHALGRAGNAAGLGYGKIPTWDTTAPSQSVQSGAGGGYATVRIGDIFTPYSHTYRPTFAGTFTGNIDNIASTLYVSSPVYQSLGTDFPMLVRLTIDDEVIFEQSTEEIDVAMKSVSGNTVTRRIDFAFTDVYAAMESLGKTLDGEHAVELSVIQRYWGDGNSVIFYDTTEVPSGLVFNHEPVGNAWAGYTKISTLPPEE